MTVQCPNCGCQVDGSSPVCPRCGAGIAYAGNFVRQPVYNQSPNYSDTRFGIPAPGFSDRVHHPEILASVKKSRKIGRLFAFFVVPLPFIGFVIYSLVSDKLDISKGLIYGAIVSAVFLIFALYGFFSQREEKAYEAIVTDKRSRRRPRHKTGDDRSWITEFTTFVKTVDGRKKKIVETDDARVWAWNYLNTGDRFRYHPQFSFPYERYDKASAPCIYCVGCQTQNPVTSDRCRKCGLPLLK